MNNQAIPFPPAPSNLDAPFASVVQGKQVEGTSPQSPSSDTFSTIPLPNRAKIPVGYPALPPGVVARSPRMGAVLREAALVAPSDARVLLTGESGVGKEVLADLLHAWSRRAANPIIKVNCAAIPDNLLESELFGHEKGAFTGATTRRIGRFEQANQGTILLDEISEMSPQLQAKLLRVTQDGRLQRLGSNAELQTSARIIAASNRDLHAEVAAGRFREDLLYRLNVMELHLPPLRDRREDIEPLATRFVTQFSQGAARLSRQAIDCMERYHWPGNVRELRNAMERAVVLAQGEWIHPQHLPERVHPPIYFSASKGVKEPSRIEEIEYHAIARALVEHGLNRTETARYLGLSRRALLYKLHRMRELGYEVDSSAPAKSNTPASTAVTVAA